MSLLEKTLADLQTEHVKAIRAINANTGRINGIEALVDSINDELQTLGSSLEISASIVPQTHRSEDKRVDLFIFVRAGHLDFRQALANLDLESSEVDAVTTTNKTKTVIILKSFEDIAIWMLDEPAELKAAA